MIVTTRHQTIFNPFENRDTRVAIIGAGAIGSKIALSVAKLGIKHMSVWDEDNVEEHNIANQAFSQHHIGLPKVFALSEIIEQATHLEIDGYDAFWKPEDGLEGFDVVFACADSMKTRTEIFEASEAAKQLALVADTRMAADVASLMTYNPHDERQRQLYKGTLFSDDGAFVEVSACGQTISVGPTSDIVAGYAVWQFIRHMNGEPNHEELSIGARNPEASSVWS